MEGSQRANGKGYSYVSFMSGLWGLIGKTKPVKWQWYHQMTVAGWKLIKKEPTWLIEGTLVDCPKVGDIIWGLTNEGRVFYMNVEKVTKDRSGFIATLGRWYYDPDQYISSYPGD